MTPLLSQLKEFGQEHLLAFWDRLSPVEQENLGAQIKKIDFALVDHLYRHRDDHSDIRGIVERSHRPPAFRLDKTQNRFTPEQAKKRGEEAIKAGEIGALLVAGGQGTRLGFDHPKGMYPVGPVSKRTLFQIFVDRIRAISHHYGVRIPLFLQTSPATHDETIAFFRET